MRRLHRAHQRRRHALLLVPGQHCRGKKITTIEGLAAERQLHPVQQAWLALDVPQCGYCQSGMIMAAAALLKEKPKPTDADIDAAMTNICRCGTYQRIRDAIHAAAATRKGERNHEIYAQNRSPFLPHRHRRAGLALGFDLTLAPRPRPTRRPKSTPGSWSIRTTAVVIRIAQSEMGQGTLTGLCPAHRRRARLRLVEGHDRISHPRPERRAQARLGRLLHRRQPAASALRNELVRKGGAAAAMMLIQAAADDGRCRPRNAAPRTASSPTPTGRTTTFGKVASAAAKVDPPTDVPLKDPKTGRSPASR